VIKQEVSLYLLEREMYTKRGVCNHSDIVGEKKGPGVEEFNTEDIKIQTRAF
jgi:hypothetical protein